MSDSTTSTIAGTPSPSTARKYSLLLVFCLAQFLDACNNCSLFAAIPSMKEDLGMTAIQATWMISGFQLTFASFLLLSGRISDVYNPKYAFIGGISCLGLISIGAGFVRATIPLITLRALSGIAGAMTIPSALTLIVRVFPEPSEQSRAIGIFGGCGAVGAVLGLVIGGIIVQLASWHWVFYFVALVAAPIAAASTFLIPPQPAHEVSGKSGSSKFKTLDLIGVSVLTVAIIVFIFAITQGSAETNGWGKPQVIVPLVVAVLLVAAFLFYETRIPEDRAAVPPRTWFIPNFAVLFGVALLPFFFWVTLFIVIMILWQQVYNWSAISCAVRMIPIGVLAFVVSFSGPLSRKISSKWLILTGLVGMMVATLLLTFADKPDSYWPLMFPAFIVGSGGAMLSYTHTNIALFRSTPASMAGTVGAIFNGGLQLGSAVGIAAVTSIETSVEAKHGGFTEYHGRRAALWFLFGIICLEIVSVTVFYRDDSALRETDSRDEEEKREEGEKEPQQLVPDISV